jgi:hypothetical protein
MARKPLAFPFLTGLMLFSFAATALAQTASLQPKTVTSPGITLSYPDVLLPKNAGATTAINEEIQKLVEFVLAEFSKEDSAEFTGELSWAAMRNDKGLISLLFTQFTYFQGAAHPSTWLYARTFSEKDGALLALKDLFLPDSDWTKALDERMSSLIRQKQENGEITAMLEDFRGVEATADQFYLTDDALVLFWEDGDYTPHCDGTPTFSIPLTTLAEYLKPDLFR